MQYVLFMGAQERKFLLYEVDTLAGEKQWSNNIIHGTCDVLERSCIICDGAYHSQCLNRTYSRESRRISLSVIRLVTKREKKNLTPLILKIQIKGNLPGGPVVNTSSSKARGVGSIPGWGDKIPGWGARSWSNEPDIKQKQYCNKFNKDFKNGPHQKIFKKCKLKNELWSSNNWSDFFPNKADANLCKLVVTPSRRCSWKIKCMFIPGFLPLFEII